jgi:molecular chaperone DnaJ
VSKRDYYEVLGITRDADDQAIKSTYRKLALQHHPDRNPESREAEDRFKEAAEAYSVLSDSQKRAAYDRFGHAGVPGAAAGGFDATGFPDLSEILNDVFFGGVFGVGGAQRRNRAQRGDDLRYDLEIGFEDSMRGLSADIQVPRKPGYIRRRPDGENPRRVAAGCAPSSARAGRAPRSGKRPRRSVRAPGRARPHQAHARAAAAV